MVDVLVQGVLGLSKLENPSAELGVSFGVGEAAIDRLPCSSKWGLIGKDRVLVSSQSLLSSNQVESSLSIASGLSSIVV